MCIFNTTLQSHFTFCVFQVLNYLSSKLIHLYDKHYTIDKEVWLVHTIMQVIWCKSTQ